MTTIEKTVVVDGETHTYRVETIYDSWGNVTGKNQRLIKTVCNVTRIEGDYRITDEVTKTYNDCGEVSSINSVMLRKELVRDMQSSASASSSTPVDYLAVFNRNTPYRRPETSGCLVESTQMCIGLHPIIGQALYATMPTVVVPPTPVMYQVHHYW